MILKPDYDILASFRNRKRHILSRPIDERVFDLEARGLLEIERFYEPSANGKVVIGKNQVIQAIITIPGLDALTEFDTQLEKQCQDTRKERNNNVKAWVIPLVTAVVSSGVTLFIEHFIIPRLTS